MVSLVKDGLLKNLDGYAAGFGWDKWPAAQLAQNRVAADGTRGSGSLYAMGLNYSLTGVFYNKQLAAQIGMTEPPETVAEFEALLAAAKAKGILPIMVWNAAASGMAVSRSRSNNSWRPTVRRSRSTTGSSRSRAPRIDTPSNLTAAEHLQQWIKAGYFPTDVNAIQYTDANARFRGGRGPVHLQRRLGERELRQGHGRQCRVLPDLPAEGQGRVGRRHVRRH